MAGPLFITARLLFLGGYFGALIGLSGLRAAGFMLTMASTMMCLTTLLNIDVVQYFKLLAIWW